LYQRFLRSIFGLAFIFWHLGMCRFAVSSANFRPQCGHGTLSSSTGMLGICGMSFRLFPAANASSICLLVRTAFRSIDDCAFHFFFANSLFRANSFSTAAWSVPRAAFRASSSTVCALNAFRF